jgi:uncharacterized HAD superfamily protein
MKRIDGISAEASAYKREQAHIAAEVRKAKEIASARGNTSEREAVIYETAFRNGFASAKQFLKGGQ